MLLVTVAAVGMVLGCSTGDDGDADTYRTLTALQSELRDGVPGLGRPVAERREGRTGLSGGGAHVYAAFPVDPAGWQAQYEQIAAQLARMGFTSTVPRKEPTAPATPGDPRNWQRERGRVMASVVYFPTVGAVRLGSSSPHGLAPGAYAVVSFAATT